MADIFISYAREDRPKAKVLAEALADHGWDVWWDRNVPVGKSFHEVIENAIAESGCVVVLWSKFSVLSDWVRNEAEEGRRRGILAPVLLEEVAMPLAFRHLQTADLSDWEPGSAHAEFDQVIDSIARILGSPEAAPPRPSGGHEPSPADRGASHPGSPDSKGGHRPGVDIDTEGELQAPHVRAASDGTVHLEEAADTAKGSVGQKGGTVGRSRPTFRSKMVKAALLVAVLGLVIGFGTMAWLKWQDEAAVRDIVAIIREGAESGVAFQQHRLAELYSEGRFVPKDDAAAMKWYREAAENGYADAQYQVARLYDQGRDVPRDDVEALEWYRKAAEQGHIAAQYFMGNFYAEGRGVPKDDAEATKWFKAAAEQGDAPAQGTLGTRYALGIGVTKDEAAGAHWLRKGAEQGDAQSQTLLGFIYADGLWGMPEDDAEALKWWRSAARQGEPGAQKQLKKLGLTW
jgi:hypothetical protein